jgi:hypothetical protein
MTCIPRREKRTAGNDYWEWIDSQPNAVALKARVLIAGHKLGYTPRIWEWSVAQVEAVQRRLAEAPAPWGGSGGVK